MVKRKEREVIEITPPAKCLTSRVQQENVDNRGLTLKPGVRTRRFSSNNKKVKTRWGKGTYLRIYSTTPTSPNLHHWSPKCEDKVRIKGYWKK